MSGYALTERADRELTLIVARVEFEAGVQRAELVRSKFMRAFRRLSENPGMGHERADMTTKHHRFWSVYSYLIVYRPELVPLEIVDILLGARGSCEFFDRVGEPASTYPLSGWDGGSVVDVPLNAQEIEYVRAIVRSGRAASEADVLRDALQASMDREAENRREVGARLESEAWREEVRQNIESGYRELLAGDTVDGEEFMEQLRLESEARRRNVS